MFLRWLPLALALLTSAGPVGPVGPLGPVGPVGPVRSFSPQYPLWSDGAQKQRRVYLPPGTTIDVSNPDHWEFPDGTIFWKDFSVAGRLVETRELRKRDGTWQFAAYQWNAGGTEKVLVPDSGALTDVEIAPGKRYRIPSIAECRACHVSSRVEILGFNAVQLSTDRDPNALHATPLEKGDITLETLIRGGQVSPARPDWITAPPRIAAPDPQTRAVLGYLSSNCGSCHNASGELASVGLDLKASVTNPVPAAVGCAATRVLLTRTGLDRPGRWKVPGIDDGLSRIVSPGEPRHSALLARMQSRRPSSQMPAMGTLLVDSEAVALLTDWIAALRTCL